MLEKVFIKNYLSIAKEQELKISNRITTLIGGNASGKTTILKAINKLNGQPIEEKEKNIQHVDDETEISAKFRLSPERLKELNDYYKEKNKDAFILFPCDNTLYYYLYVNEDGTLSYLLKDEDDKEYDIVAYSSTRIVKYFKELLKKYEKTELEAKIISILANLDYSSKILEDISEEEKILLGEKIYSELERLNTEISEINDKLFPNYRFIYMNSFKDVLVDEISIDSIDENKTVMSFLNIAGITKDQIIKAVEEENPQKIKTLENKTVSVVTEHFKNIFTQVKDDEFFKLSITIDNKNRKIHFFIQNKITGECVLPFSAESEGMKWYLSMYLKLYDYFENESKNYKYILLLDEPNIYLHAEAQKDLLENVFKLKLNDVQVIYSTHSPYMIDAEDLFSLRIVDKDEETKIFNTTIDYLRFRKKDEKLDDVDILSPVLIATGINISNQLTISPNDKIVVVEGIHDFYMLSAMKKILKIDDKDLKFIPCQGASKVPYMCGYLYGLGYKVTAVLDNDEDGRKALETLKYENENLDIIRAVLYQKRESSTKECILENLFSKDDKKKHMPRKSTVKYREIYDIRDRIVFEEETLENFKYIFNLINKEFDK